MVKEQRSLQCIDSALLKTNNKQQTTLQTIVIPCDSSINWNEIKQRKHLIFKTIDDFDLMNKVISSHKDHYFHQVQGPTFKAELLSSLLGNNCYTSFGKELLQGSTDLQVHN